MYNLYISIRMDKDISEIATIVSLLILIFFRSRLHDGYRNNVHIISILNHLVKEMITQLNQEHQLPSL